MKYLVTALLLGLFSASLVSAGEKMELPTVPVSSFFVRKMAAYLKSLNQDHREVITRKDFEQFADRYEALAEGRTGREKQVRINLLKMWDYYFEPISKLAPVTPKLFAKSLASQPIEKVISSATNRADVLFDLIDVNADGKISLDEFKLLHKVFYLTDSTTEAAFKALDKNNKGEVEYDEFVEAVILYFTPGEERERPDTLFFGPLEN